MVVSFIDSRLTFTVLIVATSSRLNPLLAATIMVFIQPPVKIPKLFFAALVPIASVLSLNAAEPTIKPRTWRGQWIAAPEATQGLPVFRKTFQVGRGLEHALVAVTGLGHYELRVNGSKVGDHFLSPAWSVYETTAYYDTFDITTLLKPGQNEFKIMLGKGFYNTRGDRRVHGVNSNGQLMAILEADLEFTDGNNLLIKTDGTWEAAAGPVTHSAILAGEDYDATRSASMQWSKAVTTSNPAALLPAESPPMKLFERLSPIGPPDEPQPGIFIYDFGQNLSAIPSIQVHGPRGSKVRLTPAEQRHGQSDRHNNGKGRVNQGGVGSPNYYEYTLNGAGKENWQPQFTYGGFQYLEVTGAVPAGHPNPGNLPVVEKIESVHVRSSAESVGAFACSNPLFNRINEVIDRAVKSNLAHVLTDCPTREKLGWLEVAYLMGPSISRNYDVSRLYAKITRDIRDSQQEDGAILTVAPAYPQFKGGFRYTPEWGAAGVVLPWQLYRWYEDTETLKDNLPAMKAFVQYMEQTSNDLVPLAGLGDWYDYGHGKRSGPAKFTPATLTAMATFYLCADIVSKACAVMGESAEAASYHALAEKIRTAFNEKFYTGNGTYQNHGSPQTANAMALVTGLCATGEEQAVLGAILSDLKKRNYQQTAGDVGFHYLIEALGRYGQHQAIERILNRREEGSYGFIIDRGWHALPEAWDANTNASMNHCMLGHAQQWFSMDLLGIRQEEDSAGFKKIIIKPAFDTSVVWARGHYDSINGRIAVAWEKKDAFLHLDLHIPGDSTATIYLPGKVTAEALPPGDVSLIGKQENTFVYGLEGGRYRLQVASDK